MYFKMYFSMFMTLCLFGHVEAKCLANTPPQETTSSSAGGCMETYTPECGNLTSLFDYEFLTLLTSEQDGCTVFSCPRGLRPLVHASFENTELPKPTDIIQDTFIIVARYSWGQVEDMLSQFGIECDGDKWKVTKYLLGIHYATPDKEFRNLGRDGSYDGMKTEVMQMTCSTAHLPGD
ncbi:C-type LECtin [Caenorhabditis elegans]|uniref:C-type LECtin n=1 Tax=Caenorhabditis elegans TaxID=6239 RepID=Q9U5B4_CAEEL|nr:C-type LECtin [Caenorhabditis elegans]CCD69616.2 C-type LECtin [Caenorhabditis elegans]|eukprot:NP_494252.2 Uncharacterized protein CELE_F43C11.2 [Caenorhabditis elegans]